MTDFLTFEQLLEHLGKYVVPGMSVEQFVSVAMKKGFGPVGQGGLWFNYAAQASSAGSVATSIGTASELWATSGALASTTASTAVTAGTATTTVGAVTTLPTVAEVVTTSTGASSVTTGAGTMLGVSTSTAMAAIAPVLGVSIGIGAYESNPEFWTDLSMKLLPFMYDEGDTLPLVLLNNGKSYLSEDAVKTMSEYFKSQGLYDEKYEFPSGAIGKETVVTSITPMAYMTARAISHCQSVAGQGSDKARKNLEKMLIAFSSQEFLEFDAKYPNNAKVMHACNSGGHRSIVVFATNLKIGSKVKDISIIDRYYSDKNDYGTVSSISLLYQERYEDFWPLGYGDSEGAYKCAGFNGVAITTMPENTTKISNNHDIDNSEVKHFISGVDENGKPITKPFIPVKLPASNNGSSTSTKEESQDASTDDKTLPFLIELINQQKKPKPNPLYKPDADPSQSATPSPDNAPNRPNIPVLPFTPPKEPEPPSDSGVTPPIILPMSSNADGLVSIYNPTKEQVKEFGKWLWTTWSSDILDTLSKMFNNPMDAVIGLHLLYATPSTGNTTTIKAGYLDSNVPSLLVDKQYTQINCGSMIIPEYWHNYLDYAPYTTINCYLPFIGMVELEPKDVINCAINITYTIDAYNGSCIAQITTAKDGFEAVTYQFSGNCAVQVPMSAGNYSSILSTAIGLAASGLATYATGGAAAPMLAGATASMMKTGTNVSHSGSFGASHGAMGIKRPFIEIKSNIQKKVNYNEDYGYPAHKRVRVSECSGFLKLKEVNVVSSTATSEEKKMIKELLKSGVYVD